MNTNTYTSSYFNLASYYTNKILANVDVRWDAIRSKRLQEVELGILGCYHRFNVGDMALGISIQRIAESKNVSSQLKSIHRDDYLKYSNTLSVILGGGSITLPENFKKLKKLMSLSRLEPINIAIIGVDLNTQYFTEEIVAFLREVQFISCRCLYNKTELNLQKVLDRNNIVFHPDLAFSLYSDTQKIEPEFLENKNKPKILGINMYPWYSSLKRGKWVSEDHSRSYFGDSSRYQLDYSYLSIEYIKLFMEIIRFYQDLGYVVHHIPFAVEDDLFARSILRNTNVIFNNHTSNPYNVLKKMSDFSLFVGTRLHANIFALIQGIPLISIAYGKKCENLFVDLGIPHNNQITHENFIQNNGKHDFFLDIDPVVLPHKKLHKLSSDVKFSVERAIELLSKQL